MAINNDCGRWPATKRVTILLAPADLPKTGTHYDLAIAIAVLAADKQQKELTPDLLDGWAFIGELSVSGGAAPGAGRAADGHRRRRPRHHPGVRPRAAGGRGRAGARA